MMWCLYNPLKVVGYKVELLEYHDLKGQFHKADYSEEGGRVERWDLILRQKKKVPETVYEQI